jgi:hypothetical protein
MLDRSPRPACLECGLPADSPAFAWHAGQRENGPAYWSDRGLLCSPVCATAHVRKRRADGTEMRDPAPAPVLVRR